MAGGQIVVVGSINFDLIFPCERIPRPGETLHSHGSESAPGGKGANQAVAAARLGGRVAMVGAVGDDTFADQALSLLVDAGVNLTALQRVSGATGVAIVYVQDDGENSILLSSGANLSMTAELVDECAELIETADVLVLQGEIPRPALEAAARHSLGRLVFNLAPVIAVDPEVLRRANPLVVNEYEGRIALEMLGNEVPKDDEGVVAGLLDAGILAVVLTRGARGAVAPRRGARSLKSPARGSTWWTPPERATRSSALSRHHWPTAPRWPTPWRWRSGWAPSPAQPGELRRATRGWAMICPNHPSSSVINLCPAG